MQLTVTMTPDLGSGQNKQNRKRTTKTSKVLLCYPKRRGTIDQNWFSGM